jgi:hypothetical protein
MPDEDQHHFPLALLVAAIRKGFGKRVEQQPAPGAVVIATFFGGPHVIDHHELVPRGVPWPPGRGDFIEFGNLLDFGNLDEREFLVLSGRRYRGDGEGLLAAWASGLLPRSGIGGGQFGSASGTVDG